MERRWRQEAARTYQTLEPYAAFTARLVPLQASLGVADPADLYATYSTLLSKGRSPQLQANTKVGFYYFLAEAEPNPLKPGETLPVVPEPVRMEAVVPVSNKHTSLTMETIKQLSQLEDGSQAAHILLGVVDDDGSVSLMRCFNYIQAPFEGPETLPPLQVGQSDEDSD